MFGPKALQDEKTLEACMLLAVWGDTFEHMAVSLSNIVAKGTEHPRAVYDDFIQSLPRERLNPRQQELDFTKGFLRFDAPSKKRGD